MTERSLEWILLIVRTVLSGDDVLEENLSNKPNLQERKIGFRLDMMMMIIAIAFLILLLLKHKVYRQTINVMRGYIAK